MFAETTTKKLRSSFLALTGAAVISAMSFGAAMASEMSLKMGLGTWVGYSPLYIAMEQGFFEEEGLDFDLTVFPGNEGQLAFAAGQVDAYSTASSSVVVLKGQGKDFKLVYIADFSTGGDGILAKNNIGSIADFKGQKIAVEEVGVSHFYLLQVLADAGLSEDDVTLVNLAPDAAAAAYRAGQVDIAVTYAPYLGQVNAEVPEGRIIHDTAAAPTLITDFYLFDTAFVEENPEAVQAFVNGILKGQEFMETNRMKALEVAAASLEMSTEALEGDLKGIEIPPLDRQVQALGKPGSDLYVLPALENLAQFLVDKDQIDSIPALAELLEPKFVEAAAGM